MKRVKLGKDYLFINMLGVANVRTERNTPLDDDLFSVGNYFNNIKDLEESDLYKFYQNSIIENEPYFDKITRLINEEFVVGTTENGDIIVRNGAVYDLALKKDILDFVVNVEEGYYGDDEEEDEEYTNKQYEELYYYINRHIDRDLAKPFDWDEYREAEWSFRQATFSDKK